MVDPVTRAVKKSSAGVRAFGVGNSPEVGEVIGVNLGCLEDASPEELAAAPTTYCDGKNDNWQNSRATNECLQSRPILIYKRNLKNSGLWGRPNYAFCQRPGHKLTALTRFMVS